MNLCSYCYRAIGHSNDGLCEPCRITFRLIRFHAALNDAIRHWAKMVMLYHECGNYAVRDALMSVQPDAAHIDEATDRPIPTSHAFRDDWHRGFKRYEY